MVVKRRGPLATRSDLGFPVAGGGRALQREDLPVLAHPAQRVPAERPQPAGVARRRGELGRDQHPCRQRLAQGLDPRRLVDRRPDDREVEPVGGADIAIEHLADMQSEVDRGNRLAGPSPFPIQPIDRMHRLDRGVERFAAALPRPGRADRKGGEHAVAEEFQHLPAATAQRRGQGLEDVVEQCHHGEARRGVGDRREAAEVGIPEDRVNAVERTARHRALMHAPAGIGAEIGREQTGGNAMAGIGHHGQRHRRQYRLQQRQIVLGKARPSGRSRTSSRCRCRATGRRRRSRTALRNSR